MLGIVKKDNNNQKYIQPMTSDARIGNPLGTILAVYTTRCPVGYLPCDGSAYDTTQYPALYALLGSDHLPDLREATLKGIGLTSLSSTHYDSDGLSLGEFIDDRVKNHTHDWSNTHNHSITDPGHTHNIKRFVGGSAASSGVYDNNYTTWTSNMIQTAQTGITINNKSISGTTSNPTNNGATNEVKSVGVFYVIKAVPGVEESQSNYVAGVFEDYVNNTTDNVKMKFSLITWGAVTAGQTYTKTAADLGLSGKQLVGFAEAETGGPLAYDNHQIHIAYAANTLSFDCTQTQGGCNTYGVIFYR